MLEHVLAPKFILFYIYLISASYVHLRGNMRYTLLRQMSDHSTLMAPINGFMYLFSAVPNQPYVDVAKFPEFALLRDNWQVLQEEAKQLVAQGHIRASEQYDDIGFNSFFRTGWKRFYLKWYGEALPSANELAPRSVSLVSQIPSINAAMFAMLPKGSRLVRHRDPYAGSLRYHLGLITPNSEQCRILVDGKAYFWRNGEDIMFDETYIHYAENESDMDRIILFCDVARPMRFRFASAINRWVSKYVMSAAAAQNLQNDKLGFFNKIFKYLYQVRIWGKRLKKFNRRFYYVVKYTLFFLIIAATFFYR